MPGWLAGRSGGLKNSMSMGNGGSETTGRLCESSCRLGVTLKDSVLPPQPAGYEVSWMSWPVHPVGLSFTSFLSMH